MMVACFCGDTYEAEAFGGICPSCGEVAAVPVHPSEAAQMEAELQAILEAHDA